MNWFYGSKPGRVFRATYSFCWVGAIFRFEATSGVPLSRERDAPGELVLRFEAKFDGLIERMLKRRGRRRRFFRWGCFSDGHDFGKLRLVAVFFLGVMQ